MDIDEPPQPTRPPGSTTPAGLELRLKLLGLFCKSAAAANSFPQTLEVSRIPLPDMGWQLFLETEGHTCLVRAAGGLLGGAQVGIKLGLRANSLNLSHSLSSQQCTHSAA